MENQSTNRIIIKTLKSSSYLFLFLSILLFTQCRDNDPMMELEPEIDLCIEVDCGENGECIDGSCLCEEDYFGENCEKKKGLVKAITKDQILYREYDYDSSFRVKNEKYYDSSGEMYADVLYDYLSSDTLILSESLQGIQSFKIYRDGSDEITYEKFINDELSYKRDYSFAECGVKKIVHYAPDNSILVTYDYEFSEDGCSYLRSNSDAEQNKFTSDVMVDHNRNVDFYSYDALIDYNLQSTGNIIQRINSENNIVIESSSYNVEFEFNEDGFPKKEIKTYLNGDVETFEYSYYE